MAAEEVKATLDFTGTAWNIPTSGTNTEAAQFTDGTYTITLAAATNYKQNSGYLILGKQGSTLTLPAFTWKTTKIRVTGSSGASESVKQNIFVGETAVSTETTGAKNVTNEYAIAAAYQAAGNVYVLKVTSSHNTQITKIEVYGESGDTPAEPVVEYYLVGTMNNWTPATGYKLAANGANAGEYMLKTTFAANDQFKVRKVIDGEVDAWYPDGVDNNYTITEAGKYNVYFRPDGQGGEGWHQGYIYAARILPKTCAEVYSMAKDDEVLLNDLTVTYVNGKNVYVKDASGAMLLYLPEAAEWAAGDVLSGVEGTVDIYKNLYEVKPSAAQVAAVTATAGTAPEPIEFTAAPEDTDMNKYVVMKNVSVSAASFPDNKNMDVTIGDQTIVLRNNFNANIAFDTEKTYDITGVVAVYNTTVQVYFISAEEYVEPVVPADRRINAYGLNVVASSDNEYTFSYYANIDGNAANLLFYKNGVLKGRVAVDAPEQGVNDVTLAKNEIPQGTGLTWAVELKANPVAEFAKIYEDTENVLQRAHSAVDNSPESDYMGRVYVENRTGTAGDGGIYVYNPDYTIHTANTKCGLPSFRSAGRPDVASDGTLWMADWGDGGNNAGFGIASVNPATLVATPFFNGTQATNGLWTNAGVEMGSSCAGVGLFGEGENMKLYAMNEDGQVLPTHGCVVYNIGQEGGSILKTWDKAPSATWTLTGNAAQNLEVTPTSHGVFFSCNRSEGQNTASARALQLVKDGTKIFEGTPGDEGTMPQLTGCSGGGVALSRDEDRMYIVNGAGNILVYNVAWTNDVPTMTYVTTYETSFNAIGTMDLDYAGNLIVSAGSAYGTAMRLVVYAIPTDNNEIIVPAKKALVVEGTDPNPTTAIEDTYVLEVQKVIRNGQVLIIKDGKTYNMMGQIVE